MKWKWLGIGILVIVMCWIGINVYKNSRPPQVIFGAQTAAEEGTILWYLKYNNYKLERKPTYDILFGDRQDMFTLHHLDILKNPYTVVKPLESTVGLSPGSSGAVGLSDAKVTLNWTSKGIQMHIDVPSVGYGTFDIDKRGNLKVVDQNYFKIQPPDVNR